MKVHLTYTVREVAPYINWVYYFHAWGMEPRFAAIADVHDCPSCRASWVASFPAEERAKAREAMKLYDEAMGLLRQWADEPICHALFLLADAYSEGDDIVVNGTTRIPFLRQQQAGKTGYTLCLSDFIKNADENDNENLKRNNLNSTSSPLPPSPINDIAHTIGLFATTVMLPLNLQPSSFVPASKSQACLNSFSERSRSSTTQLLTLNPQPSTLNLQPSTLKVCANRTQNQAQPSTLNSQPSTLNPQPSTLSDRLAEATAERMHEEVRKHYWGYAKEESLTMRELHSEQFQGIRPAVGYPSLPDQSIIFIIDKLLHLDHIGITLSENGAMHPHCSVSGFMFAHPKAQYFTIGTIGDDQLRDYAHRRQLPTEEIEKFLYRNR